MSQLPNFLIIGAPKAGTTALYHWLEKHPQIHLSSPKEPYFFEDEYERGPRHYWQAFFADGYAGQPLIGEARTSHLYLPYVASRIHQTVPEARLVAILRNPVRRAFSHWWMMRCNGRETLPFDAALRANLQALQEGRGLQGPGVEERWRAAMAPEPNFRGIRPVRWRALLEPGYYLEHLERYLEYFPREQLCVLLHDDLVARPQETVRELFSFLGLDPGQVSAPLAPENVALTHFSLPLFRLSQRLQAERFLPRKWLGRARTLLSRIGNRPRMSDEARDWLLGHYAPHNERLSEWLGRDLSHWDR
jgi:hypothetical protein